MSTLSKTPPPESSASKRAALAERLRKAATEPSRASLSFAQQRLWFLDQLEPNSPLYNTATVVRMKGKLEVEKLEEALNAIIRRHDSLRTSFAWGEDGPVQIIQPSAKLKLKCVDLSSNEQENRENDAQRMARAEINLPFNLTSEQLIRATLLKLRQDEYLFVLNMHHIVSDEWSLKIFFKELEAHYRSLLDGRPAELPQLNIQYADYALWQRGRLKGDVLSEHLDYWKKQLKNNPPILELPSDRPRRSTPTFRGSSVSHRLPSGLKANLNEFSRKHEATLFMVALAAFKALLYRYTGQEDIIVGSPIAGRTRVETESLIGFFVNTLALRTDVSGNPTFQQLLARVRDVTLGAYAHQELPFDRLVEELHPERSLSHLPLTRLMFVVQHELMQRMEWPGVNLEFEEPGSETAKFEATVVLQEIADELYVKVEYNTDLFDRDTIQRMLVHYENILTSIAENPNRRLSELPLLSVEELRQSLLEWNSTSAVYPAHKCIHELFEQRAELHPNSVAVVFGTQRLTYGQLDIRANQLANYLRRFNVGPDVPVGLCVTRSLDMVVGLLGILKAGGAYVPLDPRYPKDRLAFMISDTNAPVILTQQRCLTALANCPAQVISLDADWELIARENKQAPPKRANSSHLAYVMYTSGSTGKPKGVAVPHKAVNRLVLNTNYIRLDATDKIAQVSNISFDAATFEVWGALLNGAQLIGITRDVALSPKEFAQELRDLGITAIFLTSALFNQVAREAPGAFSTLRTVMAGGEALDPRWVRSVLGHHPPKRLINGYGPTENTTFTCCHWIRELAEEATNVPIGRPIANTQVFILDPNNNPVPVGVAGELYTGGEGLARGYWNRPELTAEKFITNPVIAYSAISKLVPEVQNRLSPVLYRTGDLARFRADGSIEYLGRIDNQVKIRGFRIELGEIETVLSRHSGIKECAVAVHGQTAERKKLCAYYVPDNEAHLSVSELRAFIESQLPVYMVPSAFIQLNSLPLTANGKVDRKALPEPDQARPELEKQYTSPRDPIEAQLTVIWEKILGVHPIGIHDGFFDLGGHSLLAVRVVVEIEKAFKKKLRVATVFQCPTIEQLSRVIRDEDNNTIPKASNSLVQLQSKGTCPPLFLVHGAGGGMFWGYVNLSRHLGNDQPVYGFRSRGLDGLPEFERIEEMASAYVKDLRSIQPHGPYYLGGYCFGGNVAYEIARQLSQEGEEIALLALMNCAPPNSGYSRIPLTLTWLSRFIRNLFYWGHYFCQWSTSQRREFFRWKLSRLKSRCTRLIRKFSGRNRNRNAFQESTHAMTGSPATVDTGDLVDLSMFSNDERKVWEAHVRALLNYHPQSSPVRVHLFRSPGHPLWCSFDPDYGWGELAKGGVVITKVPGAHEKILEEPCVQALARDLQKVLPIENVKEISEQKIERSGKIPRNSGPGPKALSFQQQRVWFLNQLEPSAPVYNLVAGIRLSGALNSQALQRSLSAVIQRHEVLRTSFTSVNDVPAQDLSQQPLDISFSQISLASFPEKVREEEVVRISQEEKRRPFDLKSPPLVRASLIRLTAEQHVLILVAHEIAADLVSLGKIFEELAIFYPAFLAGRIPATSEPILQYTDYASWQRSPSEEGIRAKDIAYWKRQLAGAPAVLEMPTDFARPAVQTYRGHTELRRLPKELSARVSAFAAEANLPEEDILLAITYALTHRYSRQDDIVLGVSTPERHMSELEQLVGNLTNYLLIRCDVSGNPSINELIGRVRKVKLEAQQHGPVLFDRLVNEIGAPRDQSYNPIFQVMFAHEKVSRPVIQTGGLQMSWIEMNQGTTRLDLSFRTSREDGQIILRVDYAVDLFKPASIRRIAAHWERLLEQSILNPIAELSRMQMLSAEEEKLLLSDWTATQRDYPRDKTLIDLFEEQAKRTPNTVALIAGTKRLTYRQLQSHVTQIANCLRKQGIRTESLIGVCLSRSWELVAVILGVLKSGAAYVPMDPVYPKERLEFMLADTKAPVLITERKLKEGIPVSAAELLCIEDILAETSQNPMEASAKDALPSSLAYVIYTSGSTGKPKGVALEHRCAVAFVSWAREIFTPEELSGVLASTSVCFDLSIFEMFVPLSSGGKVILAENALALPTLPAAREVTLINTVPSAMRELVRINGVPASTRVVNLAGEPLPTALVDEIYSKTRVKKVYDLYGPTETTTYSTYTLRKPQAPATIGKPLANEQVYLLDAHKNLVPIGVPGELYIGGDGLARGYLNRPELTAEKFIPNPFKANSRLYRTGDLARWRSDGQLIFLGRIDHQVKIRGFRIELGEVESALKKQANVADAVVLAREDKAGDKRLVAYVVAKCRPEENGTAGPNSEALRLGLRSVLPEYMVPSVFVFLERLPLTPNGKVDRKALPEPELNRDSSVTELVPPQNDTERTIAAIWQDVLALKEIGVQDNFFNLGGHSLLAVQILSRVREAFKVELPLSALFDAPTIRDLAAGMNGKRWQSLPNNQPSLMPLPRQGEAPVSFVQERLWFLDQLEPGSHAYNVPVALRLKGPLQVNCLQVAINEVAKRHEVLRTRFAYRENKLIQVIDNFVKIELPITDLRLEHSESREQQARDLVNREAQTPFELSKAPLIRARIVQLEDNDYILVVVMHHTICDGWSFATFYRELEIFYGCFAAGNKNPLLPELPVQYADFAVWRRTCMSGEALNQELSFWKTKLSGAPIKIELPTDRPYPTVAGHKANRCSIQITQDLAQATTQLSNGEGGTPFMLLMTALAVTLHKWSAQQDLVIGTVVAGRTRHELENLIGCFMNFLPIRARLLGTESLGDIFTEVRTAVLEAQEHQDCPFEKIVEAINPERRTNQNPLYNVALLLQNFPAEPFHAEGIRAISFPVSMEAALLDLRFEAEPSSDGLTLNCEYRVDLFERTTIERLLALFHTVLTAILQSPRTQLNEIELPAGLQLQLENSRIQSQKHLLAISSNFTAEPLAESLTYWMQEIQLPAVVEFAGYNQIFQELLNPKSLFGTNELGMNIIVVRLEDWEKGNGGTNQSPDLDHLERNISEFLLSLKGAVQRSNVPFLVCVCPPSPAVLKDTRRYEVQTRMERRLATELDPVGGVYLLFPDELRRWYPVQDYYDEAGEELGHIPYTPLFFAALGTAIVRKYHCLRRPGFKVIALDCDNTLWSGVCGEDGPKGIVLDEAREALQKFMRNQRDAGVLLCLCSKNNEEDVHAVFEQRIDFPLKREHLSGWRLNWSPKSQNLKSLAQELNLGLESFIFVDDNPVECAEVEANCPQVQILQLPDEPAQIPTILEHCWAFDHLKLTSEDKQRAEMYKQNREREALRANALSLGDFIAGLDLKIEIEPLSSEQLVRVSQLTQRTNQFNFTTRRRTEMELQTLGDNYNILTVCVRDRFGDYGLTGVLIFQTESDALDVDSFLLSCRVLGRGVEHRMLAELGEIARERRLQWVNVHFNPTPKNKPAADFLENIGSAFKQPLNGGFLYRFPAGFAADVELNTQGDEALAPAEFATKEASSKNNEPLKVTLQKFTRFREIALNSNDPKQIQTRIEAHKGNVKKPNSVSGGEPITELETQLRELWQNLLHIEQIGIDDNFFEIGGHSLLAVRLFSELQRLTGRKYPLITLFRAPTIRTLAAELSSNQTNNSKSLLVPIQPKGTKPPLFLIHGAGGDVLWGYANLAAHMSKDQPIYGIKSRGQTGEPEFQRVEDMAEFYIREIRELQPHGPYYLGGYCFGGNVAYEMARRLKNLGEEVAFLGLIDATPANAGYETIQWWNPHFPIRFIRNFKFWLDDFMTLPLAERQRFILRKSRSIGRKMLSRVGLRRSKNSVDLEEVIELSHFPEKELRLWQIHLNALSEHKQAPYSGAVTVLRTRGQALFCSLAEDFCWNKLVGSGVVLKTIPGSHENIFMEPHVRALAKELTSCLEHLQTQKELAAH